MPRVQIDATQLTQTDVNFVSLVKHGANRIPFRIMKGDNETMLDLGKISRALFKKADAAPAVVAVVVSKSADQAKITAVMQAAGLVMTQKSETDAAVVYAQPGAEAGERDGVLRLNEDVALVVNGLADLPQRTQKDFCSWDESSTSFMAVLNTSTFYPATSLATDALSSTIFNIMQDAKDPAGAAEMVGAAIDDFKAYMLPCIKGIPVRAFKADTQLRKATEVLVVGVETRDTTTATLDATKPGNQTVQSLSGIGDGANANGTGYDPEEDKIRATKAEAAIGTDRTTETSMVNAHQEGTRPSGHGGKTNTGGEAPIGVDTTAEPGGIEGTQEGSRPSGHGGKSPMSGEAPIGTGEKLETSPVNDHQGRADGSVTGLMKGLQDFLAAEMAKLRTDVTASLSNVQKDVGGLTRRLEGVETRSKKTEEALNGTALGDVGGDVADPRQTRTRKSEGLPPLLDTAFTRAA